MIATVHKLFNLLLNFAIIYTHAEIRQSARLHIFIIAHFSTNYLLKSIVCHLTGCAGLLVGHPFDTVKVHLQTQDYKNPLYRGTYDCLKKIIKKESLSGLYRGISSPLASISVINAVVFGVYGNIQRQSKEPDTIFTHMCAGSAAGLSQTLICSPMELIKSRLQIQNTIPNAVKHKNPYACLQHVWANEGRKGVFKGLGMTVARDVPGKKSF